MGNENISVEKKEWFDGIQILRGLLCLLVFISHSGSFFKVDGIWGGFAVEVFFVLSGFLGAFHFKREGNILKECCSGFIKKYLQFWPLHIIMLIFALPVEQRFTGGKLVANFFMLHSFMGDAYTALSFNWISWFTSSILLCFFLAPILNRLRLLLKKKEIYLMILLFLLQIFWAFIWRESTQEYGIGYYYIYIFPVIRVIDYMQGILFYSFFERYKQKKYCINYDLIEAIILMAFLVIINMVQFIPYEFRIVVVWLPVSFGLIWIFACKEGKLSQGLAEITFLQKIGRRSFEIYVVHRMILVYASFFWGTSLFSWISALIFTLISADFASTVIKNAKLRIKRGEISH